jgi:hypothetical protein
MVAAVHRKPLVRYLARALSRFALAMLFLAGAAQMQAQSTEIPEPQPAPQESTGMAGMDMHEHSKMTHDMSSAVSFFMEESSGTAVQPSAWAMPMVMNSVGSWDLMWMGQAFLVDTQQTGPLGADKLLAAAAYCYE